MDVARDRQHLAKPRQLRVGRLDVLARAPRLDHQIDRAVLEMQPPAVGQHRGDWAAHSAALRAGGAQRPRLLAAPRLDFHARCCRSTSVERLHAVHWPPSAA